MWQTVGSAGTYASLLLVVVLSVGMGYAQMTPSGDSYIDTAAATTNYGSKTLLDVESASQTAYIQFNLSSIPAGYTGSDVTKATLKLYVNSVTKAGSFNVDYVNGTWSEATIDASNAPALGTTIAASVPLTTSDKNQYILVDITSAVQAWLNGTANDGIALVGNSPLTATFDSKESTSTSHPPELDVVFASGGNGGGITGINTASGSGLTGGGTSGTLNLSLITTCSSGQVLSWSGSAWACTTAKGTGTVKSVGSGLGLTGGPITTSGTLSINTSVVPQLAAANIFGNNNTFNVSSGGPALAVNNTGSGDGIDLTVPNGTAINIVGSTVGIDAAASIVGGAFNSSQSDGVGILGTNRGTSGAGYGVVGQISSTASNAYGVWGSANASGSEIGVYGSVLSLEAVGVWGQNGSESNTGTLFSAGSGVWGDGGTAGYVTGVMGTADDYVAGYFINNSPTGYETFLTEAVNGSTYPFVAVNDATGGECSIDPSGDLLCTGSKNAVVPVDGGNRMVALAAIESPKNWFEDFGSTQLTNGSALIALDATFTQTVNTSQEYQVFLTPYGDCKGLYVSNRSANSFEVHELGGGTANLTFGYRITAARRNYENVRFVDHTHDLDSLKRMRQHEQVNHGQPQSHDPAKKALPSSATGVRSASLPSAAASPLLPVTTQPLKNGK